MNCLLMCLINVFLNLAIEYEAYLVLNCPHFERSASRIIEVRSMLGRLTIESVGRLGWPTLPFYTHAESSLIIQTNRIAKFMYYIHKIIMYIMKRIVGINIVYFMQSVISKNELSIFVTLNSLYYRCRSLRHKYRY